MHIVRSSDECCEWAWSQFWVRNKREWLEFNSGVWLHGLFYKSLYIKYLANACLRIGFKNGEDWVTRFPCTTTPHVQILCRNWKYLIPLITQAHSWRWFSLFVTLFHFTHIDYSVQFSYTNIHWSYLVSVIHTIFLGTVNGFLSCF